MKRLIVLTVIWAGLLIGFISCNTKPNLALEEQSIRELYDNLCKYGIEGNWEEYSKLSSQNSKLQIIHPEIGQWLKGREAFEENYEPLIKSGINADFIKNDLTLFFSKSGDVAWGTIDVTTRYNDYDSLLVNSWNIVVFEKENNDWKTVLFLQSIPKRMKK
jgi:hypothetical protein